MCALKIAAELRRDPDMRAWIKSVPAQKTCLQKAIEAITAECKNREMNPLQEEIYNAALFLAYGR